MSEEKKYKQLRKLGQELHIPVPEAFWEFEVFDKEGKLIQKYKQRSHSWVRNAYNFLLSFMSKKMGETTGFGAGYLSAKRYTGEITGPYFDDGNTLETAGKGFRGDVASTVNGILVGSGTNAESFEDFALQTLIANGTGAGQLSYVLSEVPTKSYNAGTKVWTVTHIRYFNNNSGGDVSVNEVAIVAEDYASASYYYTYSRDKLSATVTIPNTGQLKATYTIQLTYPS